MTASDTAKWYAIVVGVVLVLVGLLGFIDNPIVGNSKGGVGDPLFVTGAVHNIVHLATGALALFIGYGLRGVNRANGLIAFGVMYALVLVLTLVDPDLFGILNYPVNTLDHALHAVLAVASIGVGWWARSAPEGTMRTRGM
jgi:Domain of unknown function (DUF4383)